MHNDNEKPFRNHVEDIPTKKVSTATLFSHGFDLSAPCGKKFRIMEITNFTSFVIALLFYMISMTKPRMIMIQTDIEIERSYKTRIRNQIRNFINNLILPY